MQKAITVACAFLSSLCACVHIFEVHSMYLFLKQRVLKRHWRDYPRCAGEHMVVLTGGDEHYLFPHLTCQILNSAHSWSPLGTSVVASPAYCGRKTHQKSFLMTAALNKQKHLELPCLHFKAGKGARIAAICLSHTYSPFFVFRLC